MKVLTRILIVLLVLAIPVGVYLYLNRDKIWPKEPELSSYEEQLPEANTKTPGGSLRLLMEALQKNDMRTAANYLTDPSLGVDFADNMMFEEVIEQFTSRIEYSIGEQQIDGDTATVQVSIKALSGKDALSGIATEALKYAASKVFRSETPSIDEFVQIIIDEKLDPEKLPYVVTECEVRMILVEDEWRVDVHDERNIEFIDALTGGVIEPVQNLIDQFSEIISKYL